MLKIKTDIMYGSNSLDNLSKFDFSKIMIITDEIMIKLKVTEEITKRLKNSEIVIFSDVVPDPPIDNVVKGVNEYLKFSPEAVIAVGGGSVIDAAKAIKTFGEKMGKSSYFIAIPTTSGTGSEVTSFSVITNPDEHIKYPLVSNDFLPDAAILASELTATLPENITADTGMDVITHAIEAYLSTKANEFSDAYAEKALKLAFEYLPKVYHNKSNLLYREKMHIASCMAGIAFNMASLGLNHAISHNLSGRVKLSHGRSNSILLPYVIEFNSGVYGYTKKDINDCAKRYAEIASLLGFGSGNIKIAVKNLINRINSLTEILQIKKYISDYGVSESEYEKLIPDIAEGALNDGCGATNPQKFNKNDIVAILRKIYKEGVWKKRL